MDCTSAGARTVSFRRSRGVAFTLPPLRPGESAQGPCPAGNPATSYIDYFLTVKDGGSPPVAIQNLTWCGGGHLPAGRAATLLLKPAGWGTGVARAGAPALSSPAAG